MFRGGREEGGKGGLGTHSTTWGAIILQGGHQVAMQSRTTRLLFFRVLANSDSLFFLGEKEWVSFGFSDCCEYREGKEEGRGELWGVVRLGCLVLRVSFFTSFFRVRGCSEVGGCAGDEGMTVGRFLRW